MELQRSISHMLLLCSMVLVLPLRASASAAYMGNETDRVALLKFKYQIANDPHGILNSWNDSQHFCQWQGITCGRRHQRVTALSLSGLLLSGSISPYIGNLSFLRFVNLRNNSFHGEIPQEVGRLFQLRHLNLTNNTLGGAIPVNLSHCSELRVLDLNWNKLAGNIPAELGFLKKLVMLYLAKNNLTGVIPHPIGNLTLLERFSVADNNLDGSIPNEMGQLTSLTFFSVGVNRLHGMIPPSIYNISTITTISAPSNQLNGSIPENIGLTLPNLQAFAIGVNHFSGTIPVSFANASQLELLDLPTNNFVGQVPTNLGELQNLQWLDIEQNHLGGNPSQDLNFITSLSNCSNLQILYLMTNNFGGELPSTIANLSYQLGELSLADNHISGTIPAGLDNLVNLYLLGIDRNLLTGAIPSYFGKFQKMQLLSLAQNRLTGQIPSSLGNISQLYSLQLWDNKLEGHIPSSIGNCQMLQALDTSQNNLTGSIPQQVISISSLISFNISQNAFTGSLPIEVGILKNIVVLDVSWNKLSGEIPETIGGCSSLEYLNMQGNLFQGTIPPTLASLKGIQHLDLSQNKFSGQIPEDMVELPFLQYLNLSFNDLEGKIPTEGVFGNASSTFLFGNSKLCGGVPKLRLPSCLSKVKRQGRPPAFKVIIIVVGVALFLVGITSFGVLYRRKETRKDSSSSPSSVNGLLRISYHELYQATEGFSNLIGSGGFGSVYKGKLDQQEEMLIAVKVLDLQNSKATKSFMAECRALRNIRHRNLVKIITYCSSIDFKGNDFKALIYHFMPNGSLDMWLHPDVAESHRARTLNLNQRLNIAIDVASALHYLHNLSETPIIHCDLKPSNILLDNDMSAHVSDFGLARFLPKRTIHISQQETSSIGIKGSVGYAAPEYGIGGEASTYGDVYSYGILLLEMFTGRRPTDDMFKDGQNICNYVKTALAEQLMQIVDPVLVKGELEREAKSMSAAVTEEEQEDDEDDEEIERLFRGKNQRLKCISSILGLGVACSAESPRERMNMNDVTRELNLIRGAFLGVGIIEADHTWD